MAMSTSGEQATRRNSRIAPEPDRASSDFARFKKKRGEVQSADYYERWNPRDWFVGTKIGQMTFLCIVGALQVGGGALLWMASKGSEEFSDNAWDSLWASWIMFVDPGTHTGVGVNENWGIRALAIILSLLGFTYFTCILGVVVDWIRIQMEFFTAQYDRVIANDHILVLGWSSKTLFLIKELALDNANSPTAIDLVILSENDRFENERLIKIYLNKYSELRSVVNIRCWEGDPQEADDLLRVSVRAAKNIIILGPGGDSQRSDQEVLRTILAIQGIPGGTLKGQIIAEVCVEDNLKIIRAIGHDVVGILARDVVNRVMVLSAILPDLGLVWADLMTFEGNEIYCKRMPQYFGECWHQIRGRSVNAIVIGVLRDENEVVFSPPDDMLVTKNDEILLIADDDDFFWDPQGGGNVGRDLGLCKTKADNMSEEDYRTQHDIATHGAKCVCLIGWASDTADILTLVNRMVGPGSSVHVLSPMTLQKRARKLIDADLTPKDYEFSYGEDKEEGGIQKCVMPELPELTHIDEVKHYVGNPVVTHQLFSLPIALADAIMILADDEVEEAIESDSSVLTSLLHLSMHEEGLKCKPSCEILDWRSERIVRKSATLKERGNFVRSAELETGVFALCAHNPIMGSVMKDLVSWREGGAKVTQVCCTVYVESGSQYSFREMACFVQQWGETLLGYSLSGEPGISLNPLDKNKSLIWSKGDSVLVLTNGVLPL